MGANKLNLSRSRRIYICGRAVAVPSAGSDGGKAAVYKNSAKTSLPAGNTLDQVERRGTRRQKSAAQYAYAYGTAVAVPNMVVRDISNKKGVALLYYKCINAVNKFFSELGALF